MKKSKTIQIAPAVVRCKKVQKLLFFFGVLPMKLKSFIFP